MGSVPRIIMVSKNFFLLSIKNLRKIQLLILELLDAAGDEGTVGRLGVTTVAELRRVRNGEKSGVYRDFSGESPLQRCLEETQTANLQLNS